MTSFEAGLAAGWSDFQLANTPFQMLTVFKALPANEKLTVCTAHSTDIKSNIIKINTNYLCVCIYITHTCIYNAIHICHVHAVIYVFIFKVYRVEFI